VNKEQHRKAGSAPIVLGVAASDPTRARISRNPHPFSWAMIPAMSPIPQCSTILPSAMRKMSQEVNQNFLWVGSIP